MVKLKNVFKSFDNFNLTNINIEVPAGFICGMVGQNGAGKTTILNILLGLYKEKSGNVEIFGKGYENNAEVILDNIGTVLVEDYFDEYLSLWDNSKKYGKYFSRYTEEKLSEYFVRFNLEKYKHTPYKELSKGEKLKFQYAFALAHDPKLLILDEPTGNFDPAFKKEFFGTIKEFIANGDRSVILATHLTDDLDKLADYLIYVEDGSIHFCGDIESFRDRFRIVHGDSYKLKLLPQENVLYMEEKAHDTMALVINSHLNHYESELKVLTPTIEEFMYFYSKRK